VIKRVIKREAEIPDTPSPSPKKKKVIKKKVIKSKKVSLPPEVETVDALAPGLKREMEKEPETAPPLLLSHQLTLIEHKPENSIITPKAL
jgi:hypothetical protein